AAAAIEAALAAETRDRLARARLCMAQVEIALAAGKIETARLAGEELGDAARVYGSSGLRAAAVRARGSLLLAGGAAAEAPGVLGGGSAAGALGGRRGAFRHWQDLNAPFEAARVRLQLAEAYEALAARDAAALERQAAAVELARLGVASGPGKAEAPPG